MWQRFTERARRVVFFAQEEAARLGENYVGTEHLLLGLVRENDSVAARILDRLGVALGRIRADIERQVTRGHGNLGQDMQLTPRAKRVIDLAYEEARQLNNNYIGTEHLLLGLIGEGDGLGARVLIGLGMDLERARAEVYAMQEGENASPQVPQDLLRLVKTQFVQALERGKPLPPEARVILEVLNTYEPWHLADVIVPHLKLGPEDRAALTTGTVAERLQKLSELLAEAKVILKPEPPV
jgi:ATP-dependent Clp protease ATP-binding subunit ClpA